MEGVSATSGVPRAGQSRGGTGSSVGLAAVDAVEQLCGRDPEAFAQLGDGADSRLALCALDLRHVTGVQAGFVGHSFLAPSSCFSELLQVRGEDIQRIGHKPHDPWPVPTVPGTIGTGRGLRREQHVIGSSRKNRRTQRQASARRATCRPARPRDRRPSRRPGDPRLRRRALICWVGDPGMLVLRTPLR